MSAPAATSARVTAGAASAGVATRELVAGRVVGAPVLDAGDTGEDASSGAGSGAAGPDEQRLREQPVAELVRPADRAQARVQDGDAVAEPFRLLEPVRGEKDRDAAVA